MPTRGFSPAQKLLREDIVDKVLKRDKTALFGVRRVLELEQVFLYLCLHDGGLLDFPALCSALEAKRPTVSSYIDLLEATHLIHHQQRRPACPGNARRTSRKEAWLGERLCLERRNLRAEWHDEWPAE
jgi:predicted AAA+ superfamily ATPase